MLSSFPEASPGWVSKTEDIPVCGQQFLQENCGATAPSGGRSNFLMRPLAVVQSLSRVGFFENPWTAASQAKNVGLLTCRPPWYSWPLGSWAFLGPGRGPGLGKFGGLDSPLGWNQKWSQSPCRGVLDPYTLQSGRVWGIPTRKLTLLPPQPPTIPWPTTLCLHFHISWHGAPALQLMICSFAEK